MRLLFAALFALASSACASDPKPRECVPQPAFALTVRAEGGAALPETTRITVKAGGGVETYVPGVPAACASMVFCRTERGGEADAGAPTPSDAGCTDAGTSAEDGGLPEVTAITCALWTDGAAQVRVEAAGFTTQDQQLHATSGDCGIVTKTATITVVRALGDGGI